jgi:WD40 repeat protein
MAALTFSTLVEEQDDILCCQMSPFPNTCSLLAYGTESVFYVADLNYGNKSIAKLRCFNNGSPTTCIAWSPEAVSSKLSPSRYVYRFLHLDSSGISFLSSLLNRLVLCAGGLDGRLRYMDYQLNPSDADSSPYTFKHVFEGHSASVTSCSFTNDGKTLLSSRSPSWLIRSCAARMQQLACGALNRDTHFESLSCRRRELERYGFQNQ